MKREKAEKGAARILLLSSALGLALGGIGPALTFGGAAWAQDDGGHEDGGHEDGGHEDGGGGKGGGGGHGDGGQHGKPVPPEEPIIPVANTDGAAVGAAGGQGGSANYLRLEMGAAFGSAGDANWLPPGYDGTPEGDPQVFFDLDMDTSAMAAIGFGRDYGNGWRSEVSLNLFGKSDFEGPWSFTIPDDENEHADMEGSVRSAALMANGYRDFDTVGTMTPFVTFGLGIAHNTMGDWTRISPDPMEGPRTFQGDSNTALAWSIGAGLSWDVGPVLGSAPAKLDLTWRYFDLGSVTGGIERVDGVSGGLPVEALNFDVTDQVLAVSLRIPM